MVCEGQVKSPKNQGLICVSYDDMSIKLHDDLFTRISSISSYTSSQPRILFFDPQTALPRYQPQYVLTPPSPVHHQASSDLKQTFEEPAPKPLWKGHGKRKAPRRAADINSLRVFRDNPVLRIGVPVGDIAAGELGLESSRLAWMDRQSVEASEDDLGIGGRSEGQVLGPF